jgi:alpha-D-ribose 1-methylphosphonate 5-triphosphate synthase subunit PhnH
MSVVAQPVGTAMRRPVPGSQQAFRTVMQALSEPGQEVTLPALCVEGIEPPEMADGRALSPGMAAMLLTLLDRESSLRLHGACDSPAVRAWLRFHTGVRLTDQPAEFEFLPVARLDPAHAAGFELGSDAAPQRGATVLCEVEHFDGGSPLVLRGPGIAHSREVRVAGVAAAFWDWRIAQQASYPRGIDLLFCAGLQWFGLPRSTRIVRVA